MKFFHSLSKKIESKFSFKSFFRRTSNWSYRHVERCFGSPAHFLTRKPKIFDYRWVIVKNYTFYFFPFSSFSHGQVRSNFNNRLNVFDEKRKKCSRSESDKNVFFSQPNFPSLKCFFQHLQGSGSSLAENNLPQFREFFLHFPEKIIKQITFSRRKFFLRMFQMQTWDAILKAPWKCFR